MNLIDSILPRLQTFLGVDLVSVELPEQLEIKRRLLLEQIEILSLGPTPPVPDSSNSIIQPPRRRPLSSVAKFFSSKRYSFPPAISWSNDSPNSHPSTPNHGPSQVTPPSTIIPTSTSIRSCPTDQIRPITEISGCDPIHRQSGPPLPLRRDRYPIKQQSLDHYESGYEIPKHLFSNSSLTLSTDPNGSVPPPPPPPNPNSPISTPLPPQRSQSSRLAPVDMGSNRKNQFCRLSLSPQLEILQSSSRINGGTTSTDHPDGRPNPNSVNPTGAVTETVDDSTLTLPKKSLVTQARRFSAFMDPAWTLAGVLSHRYKPNKWTRLNFCLLTGGSRLIAYKSGHALTPCLALFLCGSSGIYSGRDSGMEHVIKIMHPTRGTTVLAADTEEQALVWVKQINQYAQGITPTEVHSFLERPSLIRTSSSTALSVHDSVIKTACSTSILASGDTGTNGTDAQGDSGFSAPLSSGSENNSGDGFIKSSSDKREHGFRHSVAGLPFSLLQQQQQQQQQKPSAYQTEPTEDSYYLDPSTLVECDPDQLYGHQPSKFEPSPNQTTINPNDNNTNHIDDSQDLSSIKQRLRRSGGLISSMRRKVESFSSKRRARKSVVHNTNTTCLSPPNFSQNLPNQLTKTHRRTNSDSHWLNHWPTIESGDDISLNSMSQQHPQQQLSLAPPAACTLDSAGRFGRGFDWAQLELAGKRFLTNNSVTNLPLPTPNTCTLPGSVTRPNSLMMHPNQKSYPHYASQTVLTPKHGPLLDLRQMDAENRSVADYDSSIHNQVIIAGDACISIPGRVPWTTRWCCLRSHCLDIYSQSYPHCDLPANLGPNCWPLFSLNLEPGKVELGLAGDKRRQAALRLAVPSESSCPLLFDVEDKLKMGAWIRGFIQALGIIPLEPVTHPSTTAEIHGKENIQTDVAYLHNHKHHDHHRKHHQNYSPHHPLTPDQLVQSSTSPHSSLPLDPNYYENQTSPSAEQQQEPDVIYDEVCPPTNPTSTTIKATTTTIKIPSITTTTPTSTTRQTDTKQQLQQLSVRGRWSSPLLLLDSYNHSNKYALNNPKTQTTDPTTTSTMLPMNKTDYLRRYTIPHWYIPPPSRRLLAQPLPTVPSIGPSACESLTGTINSSSCASCSRTPDEVSARDLLEFHANLDSPMSEPNSRPTFWTSDCNPNDLDIDNLCSIGSGKPSVPIRRRHSSLNDLDRPVLLSNPVLELDSQIKDSTDEHLVDPLHKPDSVHESPRSNKSPSVGQATLDLGKMSSPCSAYTLTPVAGGTSDRTSCASPTGSQRTSETHIAYPHSASFKVADPDIFHWNPKTSIHWSGDPALSQTINPSKIMSARRCVSCLTGTKPTYLQMITDSHYDGYGNVTTAPTTEAIQAGLIPATMSSTLPVRHELTHSGFSTAEIEQNALINFSMFNHPYHYYHHHHRRHCAVDDEWANRASLSSNSSRTATSSGVALTADSSTPGSSSGGTTRPPSLSIGLNPLNSIDEIKMHDQQLNVTKYSVSTNHTATSPIRPSNSNSTHSNTIPRSTQTDRIIPLGPDPDLESCLCKPVKSSKLTRSNTSLILVATQLEEIQQETKSLKLRRRDLSFRLTNLLRREQEVSRPNLEPSIPSQTIANHPADQFHQSCQSSTDNSVINPTTTAAAVTASTSPQNDVSLDPVGTDQHLAGLMDDEATTSLCARLATVEMLLKHAESTEAILLAELNQLTLNGGVSSSTNNPCSITVLNVASADATTTTTTNSTATTSGGGGGGGAAAAAGDRDQARKQQGTCHNQSKTYDNFVHPSSNRRGRHHRRGPHTQTQASYYHQHHPNSHSSDYDQTLPTQSQSTRGSGGRGANRGRNRRRPWGPRRKPWVDYSNQRETPTLSCL